ncbi:hypothetical protein AOQ84DRAFT_352198 [Glonium stellatum]|uniref:Uncharacterized protein n=1 Tax=Glonium stellatum TaxID=574774 RepID=A0A8E2JX86_9PEZI|nr:hypothetical protein AOQ84DRAFT_352198 [Glonium stellatum]
MAEEALLAGILALNEWICYVYAQQRWDIMVPEDTIKRVRERMKVIATVSTDVPLKLQAKTAGGTLIVLEKGQDKNKTDAITSCGSDSSGLASQEIGNEAGFLASWLSLGSFSVDMVISVVMVVNLRYHLLANLIWSTAAIHTLKATRRDAPKG